MKCLLCFLVWIFLSVVIYFILKILVYNVIEKTLTLKFYFRKIFYSPLSLSRKVLKEYKKKRMEVMKSENSRKFFISTITITPTLAGQGKWKILGICFILWHIVQAPSLSGIFIYFVLYLQLFPFVYFLSTFAKGNICPCNPMTCRRGAYAIYII